MNQHTRLTDIQDFEQLLNYLHDELDWPISSDNFEDDFFEYSSEALGLDSQIAAKIQSIKRLRPLDVNQPWGIIFVEFEPKRLPILALRRILNHFLIKRRAAADGPRWQMEDLLFISNYGLSEHRQITFAHFTSQREGAPTLKVIDWNERDTALHLEYVDQQLSQYLSWPSDKDPNSWRKRWSKAFTLQHGHAIRTSKDLSVSLAALARRIRERVKSALEVETDSGFITGLLKTFQETLAHDLTRDAFADMVAQTITYGLLSARITGTGDSTAQDLTSRMRTNPLLHELMATFMHLNDTDQALNFDEIGVSEVQDFLSHTDMEPVIRDFGDRNPREDPVIHFYENFLAEYDQEQKVKRGVFYTPRPVVLYIVESIDALLRETFGLNDGLADTCTWGEMAQCNKDITIAEGVSPESHFVQILDPATGTGTFLVEVIDRIYRTCKKKWGGGDFLSLWNEYVSEHLLPRLYGYELLMAPYVIAHFKVSLKLVETGYTFENAPRARIYLTNALHPARDTKQLSLDFALPALAKERMEADQVKRSVRFTVILGNPPYSGHSANKGAWIKNLLHGRTGEGKVENYFSIGGESLNEKNPKWLNDDYVKFMRLAHWQIERTGQGILGFITNHSYLDSPTFRGMRESLISTFSTQYLLDLHGNSRKRERSPDGSKDENVFDIQQGVAIGLFVSHGRDNKSQYHHSDLWGRREHSKGKYDILERSDLRTTAWNELAPSATQWFLIPYDHELRTEYESGYKLTDVFPVNSVGIVTARDKLTIQFTKHHMQNVVDHFASLEVQEARSFYHLSKDSRDWKVALAQKDIKEHQGEVRPILYRPLDMRYTYYTGQSRGFICRPRPDVMRHLLDGTNMALVFPRQTINLLGPPVSVIVSNTIVEGCSVFTSRGIANVAPLYVLPDQGSLQQKEVNINPRIRAEIEAIADHPHLGIPDEYQIFDYVYGALQCPAYQEAYASFFKEDFPRIPKPTTPEEFWDVSHKGRQLRQLHLFQTLSNLPICFIGEGNHIVDIPRYKNGRIMINKTQGFDGVPQQVWTCYVGGFQVAQKWLKDRKGRKLELEDIQQYTRILSILNETDRIRKTITMKLPVRKTDS